MKQAHIYFMIALFSILALSSCTIESRLYRPGYHVEWHGGKKHLTPVPGEKVTTVAGETQLAENTTAVETITETPAVTEVPVIEQTADNKASVEKPEQKNNAPAKSRVVASKERCDDAASNAGHTLFAQSTATAAVLSMGEATSGSSGALRTIGWILIILGIVLLLLVSIVTGLLTMLVGLLFVIVGG